MSSSDKQQNIMTSKEGLPEDPGAAARVTTKIAEEQPQMRSVAYVPQGGFALRSAMVFKETKELPVAKPLVRREPAKPMPVPRRKSNWNVTDEGPGFLPPYYPLENTRRTIEKTHAAPSEIAARISEGLRLMSIAATYDDEKAAAYLLTEDHVEMNVSLFKHEGGGTIVEVQRMKGSGIAYHHHARRILDAAQGVLDQNLLEESALAVPRTKSRDTLFPEKKERENALVALEVAGSLLKKDRLDAQRLGMESLYILTQPSKTSVLTALLAGRVILTGSTRAISGGRDEVSALGVEEEESLVSAFGIRDAILSLIQNKKLNAEYADDDSSVEDSPRSVPKEEDLVNDDVRRGVPHRRASRGFDSEHLETLHNLALGVLSNSLEVVNREGTLAHTLEVEQWLGGKEFVSTLIEVLSNADVNPHDACLSAKCLGTLVEASEEARKRACGLNALRVVNMAKDIGREKHMNLERETDCVAKTLSTSS